MATFPEPGAPDTMLDSISQLVGAAISTIFSKSIAAPSDRIKLLLQNQDELLKSGRLDLPYAGIFDCIRRIYAEEGLISFWRGNTPALLRLYPAQVVNSACRPYFQSLLTYKKERDGYTRWFLANLLFGGLAGASSLAFVYSLDYARVRLANDIIAGGGRQFSGLVDVYRKTLIAEGIAGLYSGFLPSVIGIFVYRALYFGLSDLLKPVILKRKSSYASFFLGWLVTTLAGLLSYPFDTIRSHMMMTCGEKIPYNGMMDTGMQIVKSGGISALFAGASMNALRAVGSATVYSLFHFVTHRAE